jgi:hypothetical protein
VTTDPALLAMGVAGVFWPPRRAERPPRVSACEPYRELIEIGIGRGRNAVAIWQDLVDEQGFRGAYSVLSAAMRRPVQALPRSRR